MELGLHKIFIVRNSIWVWLEKIQKKFDSKLIQPVRFDNRTGTNRIRTQAGSFKSSKWVREFAYLTFEIRGERILSRPFYKVWALRCVENVCKWLRLIFQKVTQISRYLFLFLSDSLCLPLSLSRNFSPLSLLRRDAMDVQIVKLSFSLSLSRSRSFCLFS
jgi:hypothetical protein